MEPSCEPSLDRQSYSIVRLVGQGTFGKVFEATDNAKNRVAIKRIEKNANFISREVDILGIISHPNCIELKDVFYTYSEDNGTTKKYQNLVFDFVPYTLSSLLKRKRPTLQVTKAIFYQLCLALSYTHTQHIAHRDITPNNILVTSSGQLKLADFGSAKILEDDHVSMSYICSRYYRAPELLMGSSNYSTKIDVWSAGCILAEMLMGKPIFPGIDSQDQFVKIVLILGTPSLADLWAMKKNYKQNFQFPKIEPLWFGEFLPEDVPPDQQETVADLLSRMLCYNPKKRASIHEILSHSFFDDVKNVADQMKSVSEEIKVSCDTTAINTLTEAYIKSISSLPSTHTTHTHTQPSSSMTTRPLTSENSLEKIKIAQQQQQQQQQQQNTTHKQTIDSTAAGQAQA